MDEGCVKGLKELEKGITCFICQKHYTEPKILPSPCLHYYCKECVLQKVSSNKFSCPQDGINSTLPEGGVEELETAFFINLFKSRLLALKQVYDEKEVTCKECHFKSKAESFCYHCEVFICNNCVLSHRKLNLFTSHEVISLEDLKKSQAKAMTVRATKKCINHGEPLLIYCFDCDSLICRDCTMIDHKNHKSQFIKVASSETKKGLLKELVPYREVSAKLSSAVETISITKQQVEAQGESVVKDLETSFQELIQILEKRKEELVQEATAKVDNKLEKLSVQENELSLAISEVQSVIKYTERLVDNCSDNEVMSMHVGVKNQIQAGMTEHSKSGRSLEPVEEVDMGVEVKIGKALELLCRNKAKINLLAIDPAQCTVRGKGVERAVVNCTAKVTLTANTLTNSTATRRNVSVVGELKSLCNDTVVEGCVTELGAGQYEILYRPIVRGRHELCVTVDGKAVAGNPFPVFVFISPFDLGKPVHIWPSISKPRGITVNSENDIIVAEKYGDIFKLNQKGEKTILVKYSNTKLTELESIATDSEDNIYCTDYKSNKVMKCDKNGCEVKVHEIEQLTDRGSPGHWVVAVIGDEVMLLERDNKGTIMVYDREFKDLKRIISSQSSGGEFWDVSADSHDNLFVTDYHNDCVRVFSNDGVFIFSFSCDKLNKPRYVRVFKDFVYVTNIDGCYVSVFNTAGDHVSSFGKKGSGDSDFYGPFCLCLDRDGYMYIADSWNNRVKCL